MGTSQLSESELRFALRHLGRYLFLPYFNSAKIRIVEFLRTTLLTSFAWIPLSVVLVVAIESLRRTTLEPYLPAPATIRIGSDYSDFPPGHLVRYVYFQDGAICDPDGFVNTTVRSGEPIPDPITAVDPADSRRSKIVRYELVPIHQEIVNKVCVRIQPGSTQDPMAKHRRGFGYWLATTLFWAAPISTGLGVLVVFLLLILARVATISVSEAAHSIIRVIRIIARAATVPRAAPDANLLGLVARPLVAHVSDTHVTSDGRQPYEIAVTPSLWPHESQINTSSRFIALWKHVRSMQPSVMPLHTGDITDAGLNGEWEMVRAVVGFDKDAILIPGNHDLCLKDDQTSKSIVGAEGFREASKQQRDACFTELKNCGSSVEFPHLRQLHQSASGAHLLMLDSNRYASRYVLSNAVGEFGADQLSRVETMISNLTSPLIVACHHHVIRKPSHGALEFVRSLCEIAIDSRRLLRVLAAYNRRTGAAVLVVHGHKHETFAHRFQHKAGLVQIYGHPSSTMGEHGPTGLDGVMRFALIGMHNGSWKVEPRSLSD